MKPTTEELLLEIRSCALCEDALPRAPKPILQFHSGSRILIVGQAPGIRAHETGVPWNDPSGIRLRQWLGVSDSEFYNPRRIAIVPMGFCYPGRGKSGDLPPRKECRARWMDSILSELKNLERIVLIGSHATAHFLGPGPLAPLIRRHATDDSPFVVLPHPSPRNFNWFAQNEWFETEIIPAIRHKLTL